MIRNLVKAAVGLPLFTRRMLDRQGATIVFCYHDVRAPQDPPSWLRPDSDLFARQLQWFASVGRFIGPQDLDAPSQRGELRILITFDDGYRNNHRLAWPLLRQYQAPALFFVSTAHLLNGEPFWFDRVTGPLLHDEATMLDLSAHGLGTITLRRRPPAARWDDIDGFLRRLKRLGPADDPRVAAIIASVESQLPTAVAAVREGCRPLSVPELREMAADPGCHFGSHGHEHDILVRLSDEGLRKNLSESRQILMDLLGRSVNDLAYPNGDFGPRERQAALDSGYTRGFSVRALAARLDGDPMAVPRLLVGGFDGPAVLGYRVNRILMARTQNIALAGNQATRSYPS
jgi:peptidoglycan/xylan/chitin deacetylase (PgdA/CDA1 family)